MAKPRTPPFPLDYVVWSSDLRLAEMPNEELGMFFRLFLAAGHFGGLKQSIPLLARIVDADEASFSVAWNTTLSEHFPAGADGLLRHPLQEAHRIEKARQRPFQVAGESFLPFAYKERDTYLDSLSPASESISHARGPERDGQEQSISAPTSLSGDTPCGVMQDFAPAPSLQFAPLPPEITPLVDDFIDMCRLANKNQKIRSGRVATIRADLQKCINDFGLEATTFALRKSNELDKPYVPYVRARARTYDPRRDGDAPVGQRRPQSAPFQRYERPPSPNDNLPSVTELPGYAEYYASLHQEEAPQ